MPWRCAALEHFDDDHATATAGTARLAGIRGSTCGLALGLYSDELLADTRDVVGANAFGQQPVVADAMQALGQHVDEEAADELVGGEGHVLVAIAALDAVVLPVEGDALPIEGD